MVAVTAVSMLLCNTDRTLMSVAIVPIARELSLDATSVGVLQSSYLWGYGVAQIPAGLLADRFGGPRVLLFGLVLWSVATCALPLARLSISPLAALLVARAIFGFGSAVALPATSATVSALVPVTRRASSLGIIYSIFNSGSIVGLSTTPAFIGAYGWPAVFWVYGVIGILWAGVATMLLPAAARVSPSSASPSGIPAQAMVLRPEGWKQVAALFWVHCVIGWGFFLLLNYIPTYLVTQFPATSGSLSAVGLASSLPWLVSSLVGLVAGGVADALLARGMPMLRVRTLMHAIATMGPALAISILPLVPSQTMAVALLCLVTGCQAFNYAAFHAMVATVAGNRSGFILALTNTGGIVMGIVANLSAGFLLARFGSFGALFGITAALYVSSFAVWAAVIRGDQLYVSIH